MKRKIGSLAQLVNAYHVDFTEGAAKGKSCILVHNNGLEVMFSKDNALDMLYCKYNGVNISYLSKNGINDNKGDFDKCFEGGFLYTCGMDGIGLKAEGVPLHGTLHFKKADEICVKTDDEKVIIEGTIRDTEMVGKRLELRRKFIVYSDRIELYDEVCNSGYTDAGFVLLYHNNYSYPFLDKDLTIGGNFVSSEAIGDYAEEGFKDRYIITEPVDGGDEQCYYNYTNDGTITLTNKKIGLRATVNYDVSVMPVCVEWKNMISGDYALGIEPTTSRFDDFKLVNLKPFESKKLFLKINFNKI